MARIDVVMPQMGESIAEGTLSKWLKKLGDPVKRDEPIFEISTDKVDAEIPAPSAGVLAEILVQEGQTVAVQTVVARLETDASAAAAAPAPKAAAPAPAPPPPPPAPKAAAPTPQPKPVAAQAPAPVARPSAPASERPAIRPSDTPQQESLEERLRRKSTPLVRKIAAEHNLDLTSIPGSGFAGRVTKSDVLSAIEAGVSTPPVPPSRPSVRPSDQELSVGAGVRVIPGPVVEPWEGDRKSVV